MRDGWNLYGHDRECYYRRECVVCGREVFGHVPSVKYCSYRCKNDAQIARRAARRDQARNRVCEMCGAAFKAARADTRHCSPKCRQKAYRDRTAERIAKKRAADEERDRILSEYDNQLMRGG